MHVPCRSRQMHVDLADRVWKWLAFANEFSRFASCPFHCHPSCIAWLVFGLCIGFSCGLIVSGLLLALWIFRVPLAPFLVSSSCCSKNQAGTISWMSFPFTSSELRDLIERLERLEVWQKNQESASSSKGTGKGYRRGDPKARAAAAGTSIPQNFLPGHSSDRPSVDFGKGSRTRICWPQNSEPLIRVQDLFRQLWKSRRLLLPGIRPKPWIVSTLRFQQAFGPDLHWRLSQTRLPLRWFQRKVLTSLFLRACGLGGAVRLILRLISITSVSRFLQEVVYFTAFETETGDWKSFCQGAHIAVPPLFRRTEMLSKENVRPASKGEPTLLVLTVPAVASSVGDEVDVYALPLEFRKGRLTFSPPAWQPFRTDPFRWSNRIWWTSIWPEFNFFCRPI